MKTIPVSRQNPTSHGPACGAVSSWSAKKIVLTTLNSHLFIDLFAGCRTFKPLNAKWTICKADSCLEISLRGSRCKSVLRLKLNKKLSPKACLTPRLGTVFIWKLGEKLAKIICLQHICPLFLLKTLFLQWWSLLLPKKDRLLSVQRSTLDRHERITNGMQAA